MNLKSVGLKTTVDSACGNASRADDYEFLAQEMELNAATRNSAASERIPAAWIALTEILARVVHEPYHWPVDRKAFQKMAYFATEEGLPTHLEYKRDSSGPFAADLNPMIARLKNNGLLREESLGNMLSVLPGVTYHTATKTYQNELQEWEPLISRVSDLFLRMNTPSRGRVYGPLCRKGTCGKL